MASSFSIRNLLFFSFGLAILLLVSPLEASLLPGPFQSCQGSPATVGTDGTDFFFSDGSSHPVPVELQPTSGFSFSVTPGWALQAIPSVASGACPGGSEIFLYDIPPVDGDPLTPIVTGLCLPNGLADSCYYYGAPFGSPQWLGAYVQSHAPTATTQFITWIDFFNGSSATSTLEHQIDSTQLRFAPSGNGALVQHDLSTSPGTSDWAIFDLCPGTMGSLATNYADLGAGLTGEIVETSPGTYVARLTHPSLPGGQDDVSLPDCWPTNPPPVFFSLNLLFNGDGGGTVADDSGLLQCASPTSCSASFAAGSEITLSAQPAGGSLFQGWSGDCTGTSPTTQITINGSRSCTANFQTARADLEVTASGAPNPAIPGSAVTWTATLTNLGPAFATGPRLTLAWPTGVAFDAPGSSPECSLLGASVICDLTDLQAAQSSSVTVVGDLDPDLRGNLVATFSATALEPDPNASNDQRIVSLPLKARVDLSLTKRGAPASVSPGGLALWQVEIANSGPSSALSPAFLDTLPAGNHPWFDPSASSIQCVPPRVGPGQTALLTLLTSVDSSLASGTPLDNLATVTPVEIDPQMGNNLDTASISVMAPPFPAPPGTLTLLASAGDQPPGAAAPFDRFLEPAVDGDLVAYSVIYQGTFGGVFLHLEGQSLPVVERGYGAPGLIGTLGGAIAPSLDQGRLLVTGLVDFLGGYFFLSGPCGPENTLAVTNGGAFEGTLKNGQFALLQGPDSGGVRLDLWSPSGTTVVASSGTPMPASPHLFSFFSPRPGFDGSSVGFHGVSPEFPPLWEGIYAWDAIQGTRPLADFNTAIPGGSGLFTRFAPELEVEAGQLYFFGEDSAGHEGLYAVDLSTDTLTRLVDRTTLVAGTGAVLDQFFGFPSASGSRVVFLAASADGTNLGLYLWENDQIFPLVLSGDDLGGGYLAGSFLLGPQGFDGQQVVFQTWGGTFPNLFETLWSLEVGRPLLFSDGFESGDLSAWSLAQP